MRNMLDAESQRIISQNPIGTGLDEYRALVRTKCEAQGLAASLEAFYELEDDGMGHAFYMMR